MSVDVRKLVFLLLGLWAMPAVADTDLLKIYEPARSYAPELRAARMASNAASERRVQAEAAYLPTLRLSSDAGRQLGESAFEPAPYERRGVHSWSWSLQLSQSLLRPGAAAALQQAELEVARADAELRRSEQELMLKVGQAVVDVLTAKWDVEVLQAQQQAVERQVQQAQRGFEAGLVTIVDVHDSKRELLMVRAQLAQLRSALEQRQEALDSVLGTDATPLLPPLTQVSLDAKAMTAPNAMVIDIDNHPAVSARRLAVEVAAWEVRKQAQAHGPVVELTMSYGSNASTGSMTSAVDVPVRSRGAQLGVRLNLPLYEGGATRSRVREAEHMKERAGEELAQTIQQVRLQARQALTAWRNESDRVAALEGAQKASRLAANANRVEYRLGTRVALDVLNAEQQRASVLRDLYKAQADRVMLYLKLKAATGELAEAHLSTIAFRVSSETTGAVPFETIEMSDQR